MSLPSPDHQTRPDPQTPPPGAPHRHLTLLDSTSIIVGIIIGSTIFGSTPLIALHVPNVGWLIGLWVIGAVFSLIGALCYAELATAYPKEGGDYVFLTEAFGRRMGFIFAWAQYWIVRPGSIGTVAFVFAEYANKLFPLDERYRPLLVYAVGAVVVLSGINLLGVRAGKWTQNLLTAVKYGGLLVIVAVGLSFSAPAAAAPPPAKPLDLGFALISDLGFALIFVFLAYGGWNEMAYVSAEVRDPQKNILRALVLGTLAVGGIYIAVNLAFVHALGLGGLQGSKAVAADVLSLSIGPQAGKCISILICIAALGGINGMIFTGARIFYAMGMEHRLYAWLGQWNARIDTPARPLLIQGLVTVALLVGFGWQEEGSDTFANSVAFYSPSFWLFLFLVGCSLFVLRTRPPAAEKPYRVPFYPVLPLLFCINCGYLFYTSMLYAISTTPWGLVASALVLAFGGLLACWE
jgi:basic amino acid/polyamine antiporter, APA family